MNSHRARAAGHRGTRWLLRGGWSLLALALAAGLVALTAGDSLAAAQTGTGHFEFVEFNRSYRDMASDIAPIDLTGITVQLASPTHVMTVHHNHLALTPLANGSYAAELTLRFSGRGQLLADIQMAGVPSRLEDELVVPEQSRVLKLQARLARSPEGYLVTTETMPASLPVTLESRLGGQLVTICRQVGLLLGLRCGPLEQAFSQIDVPLPAAGETYIVELAQVGDEGARRLDAYLGFTAPAQAPPAVSTP